MKKSVLMLWAILALVSCKKDGPAPEEDLGVGAEWVNRCDYEQRTTVFTPTGAQLDIVDNPLREGEDRSRHCARLTHNAEGPNNNLLSEQFRRRFDFTANPAVFRLKVLPPESGGTVRMSLLSDIPGIPTLHTAVEVSPGAQWKDLSFDFREFGPDDNVYRQIALSFNPGKAVKGEIWYFDDLRCPSDDLGGIALFKRFSNAPLFVPDGGRNWRGDHMANPSVISPKDSPDGNWWLYLRGSGSCPSYCDQIGLYQQNAADFKPFGPWKEYAHNPVLPIGPSGSYDDGFLLDPAAVVGKDGVVYVYYNGQKTGHAAHGLSVRYSTDGGYTFQHTEKQLKPGYGCSDAVYYDGKYYIYYGGGNPCRLFVTVTEDPLSFDGARTYETIPIGGGPSNFDSYAVNGSMVFRLDGVDKWFASYQGSSTSYDFPDRFHIAMSDDLIHWTKVDSRIPLFTRGSVGAWDEGAIWFCEIFEHKDMLYLYYEGWGNRFTTVPDRDLAYFPGQSCIGAASCSKSDFLKWCGLSK